MFKKLVIWFTCFGLISSLIVVIAMNVTTKHVHSENNIMTLSEMKENVSVEEIQKVDEVDLVIAEMRSDMDAIESITDNMEWFISYRSVIDKYSYILDPPETVYDYFSDEDIYLIQRAVETECYDQDFDSKCNVASVIFNRINDPEQRFGKTVTEVITADKQFVYGRKNISDSTKLAVEYAFEIVDTTNGCIGFHSNKKTEKFNGWNYVFTDDIDHHFYKE